MKSTVVTIDYAGLSVAFRQDGWFDATTAAAHFGKRPVDWLKLDSTKSYIAALAKHNPEVRKFHFAQKGGSAGGGTWLHFKLAVLLGLAESQDFTPISDTFGNSVHHICDYIVKANHFGVDNNITFVI